MTDKPDNIYVPALLEEYKTLRNDIQQRIQFRFQIFGLLLIAMALCSRLGCKEKPLSQILAITLGWFIKMKNPAMDSLFGLLKIIALSAAVITLVLLIVHGRMKR